MNNCHKDMHMINSRDDLKDIEECTVLEGDVFINNFKEPFIQLSSNLERIAGSLIIRNAPNLVRLEGPKLTSIGDTFSIQELTSLALISLPELKSVKILDWKVLPILSTAHLNAEIKNIESITITDTSITAFSGFASNALHTLDLNNNRFLESITSNVEKITEKLHIAANAESINVNLSHLKYAKNLTIQETSNLDLSNLETVENSASFINNYFKQLKIPKLKSIGGTLSISRNRALQQVELPTTDEIGGGLVVVNNTAIEKVNFLPKLSIIGGAMEIVGNIKDIQLKHLKIVKGSARITAFSSAFDCSKWTKNEVGSIIRGGKIECTSGDESSSTSNDNGVEGEGSDFISDGPFSESTSGFKYNSSAGKQPFSIILFSIAICFHYLLLQV